MLTDEEYAVIAHRADQLEARAERAVSAPGRLAAGQLPAPSVSERATVIALLALSARLELVDEVLRSLPEQLAIDRESMTAPFGGRSRRGGRK